MKWYRAILLTLVILAALGILGMSFGDKAVESLGQLVAGISGVWAAAESGSFAWGLLVMFFWPVAFPWFLIARPRPEAQVMAKEEGRRIGEIVT
jgi:hypothetical protein